MAAKFLSDGDEDPSKSRAVYLKSMFFCVTPNSLVPLAVVMYQKFEELRQDYLHEVYNDDEKKVCKCHTPAV